MQIPDSKRPTPSGKVSVSGGLSVLAKLRSLFWVSLVSSPRPSAALTGSQILPIPQFCFNGRHEGWNEVALIQILMMDNGCRRPEREDASLPRFSYWDPDSEQTKVTQWLTLMCSRRDCRDWDSAINKIWSSEHQVSSICLLYGFFRVPGARSLASKSKISEAVT